MTTPGNPQDSTQSYTQPGSIPPPGQPGYGQQDSPQDHSPRGASDDQTWAMLSYILALVASILFFDLGGGVGAPSAATDVAAPTEAPEPVEAPEPPDAPAA